MFGDRLSRFVCFSYRPEYHRENSKRPSSKLASELISRINVESGSVKLLSIANQTKADFGTHQTFLIKN